MTDRRQIIRAMVSDVKMIYRDASLRFFLFVPVLIFLVVLVFLPYLIAHYSGVETFLPIIMMGAVLQTSIMFGFIYAMLFIEEKEVGTAKVYGIVPIAKTTFVIGRLLIPTLLSLLITMALLLAQPFYQFSWGQCLICAFSAALFAPLLSLGVANLSSNRMQGMTWFKILNTIVVAPLLAFFVPSTKMFLAFVPTYWLFSLLDHMVRSISTVLPLVLGLLYMALLGSYLIRRFVQVHYL